MRDCDLFLPSRKSSDSLLTLTSDLRRTVESMLLLPMLRLSSSPPRCSDSELALRPKLRTYDPRLDSWETFGAVHSDLPDGRLDVRMTGGSAASGSSSSSASCCRYSS
jgi:hypothetical protein